MRETHTGSISFLIHKLSQNGMPVTAPDLRARRAHHKPASAHYSLCYLLQFISLTTAYLREDLLTTAYINCGE